MKLERLGEKIIQVRGISYKPNDISTIPMPDYVPILKANNIKEDGLDTSDLIYIHKSKIKPEQFIKRGDLLLAASSGSKEIVGKNIYFESDFEGSFGAFCKLVRPNENINPRYLATFFKSVSYKRHIRKLLSGALINNLKNEYIDSLLIPDISDSAQLHIANILSKAENLIAQRKESIRLLDEFLKSTFLEMFGDPATNSKGWKNLTLKDVCQKIQDGTHFSPPITTKGVPYITAKHVRENVVDFWSNPWFISEESHREIYKRCNPVKGDVLYIKDGATTGYAAINPYDFEFSMLSSLALLKPKSGVTNSEYLCAWLNNSNVKRSILTKMAGGAIKRLTLTKINALPILIPPIDLQTQFARIVEKTEALKSQYQQSLQELEQLYGSLSQKAFRGS